MGKTDFEIIGHIGTLLDGNIKTELNIVRWNGAKEKFDLRRWKISRDGARTPYRGVTLTPAELQALRKILNGLDVWKMLHGRTKGRETPGRGMRRQCAGKTPNFLYTKGAAFCGREDAGRGGGGMVAGMVSRTNLNVILKGMLKQPIRQK